MRRERKEKRWPPLLLKEKEKPRGTVEKRGKK